MLSPRILIGLFGKLVIGCGAFINSRRWLIGSLLTTGLLLALVLLARPTPHLASNSPGDPDIMFDEVKTLPLVSQATDSQIRTGIAKEGRFSDDELKSGGRSVGFAFDGGASEDGAKPGGPMALSRRLDAVRSRRARGAWLTGTIDKVAETSAHDAAPNGTPPEVNLPKLSARQTPGPVLR